MSKKPFEHIEIKFREAAENFQPPLSQEAWEKMELLLNTESDRKPRPVGFWLTFMLLLLTGGGLGIYLVTLPQTEKPDVQVTKAAPANQTIDSITTKKDPRAATLESRQSSIIKKESS